MVHAPPMSVTHGVSHIDAIVGAPSPPMSVVIAATTGATTATTDASLMSLMSLMTDIPDWLTISVTPVPGVVEAPKPRSAHIRAIAKAIPTHRGRVEALKTLGATDMDTGEIVSET